MHSLKIKNLEIKEGRIPIFVAEISGNHNQKFSTALKLIKAAKDLRCGCCKISIL